MSAHLVDRLAHRFEPADSWQPPNMTGAEVLDYYVSGLDGERMVWLDVDGHIFTYQVRALAVVTA